MLVGSGADINTISEGMWIILAGGILDEKLKVDKLRWGIEIAVSLLRIVRSEWKLPFPLRTVK